jgi:hypothetical protein
MTERERLTAAFEKLNKKGTFKPGDIVDWKPGMRNKTSYGPFVVVEVLDSPIFLDIILGKVVDDGERFVTHFYDSRRFEVIG